MTYCTYKHTVHTKYTFAFVLCPYLLYNQKGLKTTAVETPMKRLFMMQTRRVRESVHFEGTVRGCFSAFLINLHFFLRLPVAKAL